MRLWIAFVPLILSCTRDPQPGLDAGMADAATDIPALAPDPPRSPEPPPLLLLAEAPECPTVELAPCVVEVVSFAEPAQIGYRLCCTLGIKVAALAVDSSVGPWADVTAWALCGWGYVVEVTHPRRGSSLPWAVLDTYAGDGGPISECASAGAP